MVCVGHLMSSSGNYAKDTSTPCGKMQKRHDISVVAGGTLRKMCLVEENPCSSLCAFCPSIHYVHTVPNRVATLHTALLVIVLPY